jgi:UDP-N-acetylglucosamine--N-acetylmuramyl-(pentapeptide) pyrophosphoryl-undecaprenol N-acetylglucosamine transferase
MDEGKQPSFGSLKSKVSAENKYRREVARMRKSTSFRVGVHLIRSIEQPWRFPLLLLTLPWLICSIGLERLGRKSHPVDESDLIDKGGPRKSIVFFPTNGVGFGHFTRMLALARRVRRIDPSIELIFFTTMPTLHLLKREGIAAYHIPGRKKFQKMDAATWNMLTEEMLTNVFTIHRPSIFIFDGAFPYRGMLNAIQGDTQIKKVWMRRGTFRKGATKIPVDSINHFDFIIHPKDSVDENHHDAIEFRPAIIRSDPIIFLDEGELRPRNDLRDRLGIPHEAVVVYLQLGAGQINDIESDIIMCLEVLEQFENAYVVLGESLIGDRIPSIGGRVRIISEYPNSLDFRAFDFTIMAAGYNSYHEAIRFSLPTLCIPNMNTGMDDQLARAEVAENAGAMIVLREVTMDKLSVAVERLMDSEVRRIMAERCEQLHQPNGANQLAKWLISEA